MIMPAATAGKHDLTPIPDEYKLYYYVSTNADTNSPAKTLYVLPPSDRAGSVQELEKFAGEFGWIDLAEADGAVLVMPAAEKGWKNENIDLLANLYDDTRRCFASRKEGDILTESVWCWETLIYAVGYGDAAAFLGESCVKHGNRFAGVALVGGVPQDYSAGALPSSHWLTPDPSADYAVNNADVPVCLWIFEGKPGEASEAVRYFGASNGADSETRAQFDGIETTVYKNAAEEARQVRVSSRWVGGAALSATILRSFFDSYIRWKNGPDGTLKPRLCRDAFYASDRYAHYKMDLGVEHYEYHVFLPKGKTRADAEGMPVVFSVHGAHEPAWVFSTKNGWEKLADETGEFMVVLPDSPKNRWTMARDGDLLRIIIEKLYDEYKIDRERVYMSGFSNGCMMTCEMGTRHPDLFAAVSPWNTPIPAYGAELVERGYQLPVFAYAGDNDVMKGKTPFGDPTAKQREFLTYLLTANSCPLNEQDADAPAVWAGKPMAFRADEVRGGEYYTAARGYTEGERLKTFVYRNAEGRERVCYTIMKNMPHGAIYDESRAAWEFLRRFRRPLGKKYVVEE